jgi:hypothetical protein
MLCRRAVAAARFTMHIDREVVGRRVILAAAAGLAAAALSYAYHTAHAADLPSDFAQAWAAARGKAIVATNPTTPAANAANAALHQRGPSDNSVAEPSLRYRASVVGWRARSSQCCGMAIYGQRGGNSCVYEGRRWRRRGGCLGPWLRLARGIDGLRDDGPRRRDAP